MLAAFLINNRNIYLLAQKKIIWREGLPVHLKPMLFKTKPRALLLQEISPSLPWPL